MTETNTKSMLFSASEFKSVGNKCYGNGEADFTGEAGPWMTVYLVFLAAFYLLQIVTILHQYLIVRDEEGCRRKFESEETMPLIKELYKYEQLEKSNKYKKASLGFLIFKMIFAQFPFDFCVMYFKLPAFLWYGYTYLYEGAGLCEADSISPYNL